MPSTVSFTSAAMLMAPLQGAPGAPLVKDARNVELVAPSCSKDLLPSATTDQSPALPPTRIQPLAMVPTVSASKSSQYTPGHALGITAACSELGDSQPP